MDGPVPQSRHEYADDSEHWRDGPLVVQCRRHSRISVHPGPAGIRNAYAPLEYGRVRADFRAGHEADGGDRGFVCVSDGESRRNDSAQAAAATVAKPVLGEPFSRYDELAVLRWTNV